MIGFKIFSWFFIATIAYSPSLDFFYDQTQSREEASISSLLFYNQLAQLGEKLPADQSMDLNALLVAAQYNELLGALCDDAAQFMAAIDIERFNNMLEMAKAGFERDGKGYVIEYLARCHFLLGHYQRVSELLSSNTIDRQDVALLLRAASLELMGKESEGRALLNKKQFSPFALAEARSLSAQYKLQCFSGLNLSSAKSKADHIKSAFIDRLEASGSIPDRTLITQLHLEEPDYTVSINPPAPAKSEANPAPKGDKKSALDLYDPARWQLAARFYRLQALAFYQTAVSKLSEVELALRDNLNIKAAMQAALLGNNELVASLAHDLPATAAALIEAQLAWTHRQPAMVPELLRRNASEGDYLGMARMARLRFQAGDRNAGLSESQLALTASQKGMSVDRWDAARSQQRLAHYFGQSLIDAGKPLEAIGILSPMMNNDSPNALATNDALFLLTLAHASFSSGPVGYPRTMRILVDFHKQLGIFKPMVKSFQSVYANISQSVGEGAIQ